jgi:hypothetical protein
MEGPLEYRITFSAFLWGKISSKNPVDSASSHVHGAAVLDRRALIFTPPFLDISTDNNNNNIVSALFILRTRPGLVYESPMSQTLHFSGSKIRLEIGKKAM